MNNLAIWCSRGSQYLQMYLAPYGLEGWKAWSICESLRWFRADEELLWKCGTAMLGSDPIQGGIYAFHHQAGDRELLSIRNPLAHPQALPLLGSWELPSEGWEQIYPYCRTFDPTGYIMASHEVIVLIRGNVDSVGDKVLVNTPQGWFTPWRARQPIPGLHDLGAPNARMEKLSSQKCAIHACLPYGLTSAEVVLSVRSPGNRHWRAGVGRYPEDVASFGVPITHVRPHWQSGYTQKRLKVARHPEDLSVLRFPVGTGGDIHAFVECEEGLPEILGAWIEGRENLIPFQNSPSLVRPPAMSLPLKHLLTIPFMG